MSRTKIVVRLAIAFAAISASAFAQLPPVVYPPENPYSSDKAVLGKILFWDEQLSSDDTTACGTCHIPTVGGGDPRTSTLGNMHPGPDGVFFTGDEIQGSRGVVRCDPTGPFSPDPVFFPNAQVTRRKSPSFIGVAWSSELFWDGRASSTFVDPVTQAVVVQNGGALESQAVGPIVSDVEMACLTRTHVQVATKIQSVTPLRLASNLPPDVASQIATYPTYPQLFNAAFGDPAITPARIGMAIATYERTLVPDQTPWDLFTAGNTSALTASQQAGLGVFLGAGNCAACHIPPLFTDNSFANIGVRPDIEDGGRFEVTGQSADKGKFKVPSLRNSGLRAPFFHTGSAPDMLSVILFYKLGGDFPGPNLDSRMLPALTMSHTQEIQLADFIENGLTDPRVLAQTYPFDRPTLSSEIPSNFAFSYGTGSAGTGGITPILLAPQLPYLGNPQFTMGVASGRGGAPVVIAFSAAQALPGAMAGPNPLWIHPDYLITQTTVLLAGGTGIGGAGYTSLVFNLPYDPSFSGATAFAQAAVYDVLAPGGLAVTAGSAITLLNVGP